ncbi:MAG: NADH-quinone oxidoreductase subunit NuoE [Gammaproteobacteria bacterium]|nr:NADH-quinone oxidoreductase subunit NuoE [Gammaproteobacteria bacterium]MYF37705.1 NADH-quinone oxidoreductase subunit NuoE [Gammaproteobacteria bacterium]
MSTVALISPLSDAERSEIEAEVAHLPDRESAAIDALMIVQKHRGWISDESLSAIAKFLEMSPAKLDGIATFYNLIHRQRVGRNVVMVCDSVSCYVMGADGLAQKVQDHLGIKFGETTPDDCFTLLPIVCLGACDRAPTMIVNEDLYGPVKEEDLAEVFSRYT